MFYNKIVNPMTGKKVSIFGKSGSGILQSYYNYLIKNETVSMKGGADQQTYEEEAKNKPKDIIYNEIVVQTAVEDEVIGADINEEVFSNFYKNNEFIKQLKDHVQKNISGKNIIDAVNSFAKDGVDIGVLIDVADTDPNVNAYIKPLFNFTIQTIQKLIGPDKPIKLFCRDSSGNIDSSGYIHISGSGISRDELKNILLVEKKRLYPTGTYPFKITDKLCLDLSGSLQSHIANMESIIIDISGKTKNADGQVDYQYETERAYIGNIKSLFETLKKELKVKHELLLAESIRP
tara:strand:- start:255 stop:1127 length:873 start_codon:yes stop_codon:yes gene_type:complete